MLTTLVASVAVLYLLVMAGMYVFQRDLLYHPAKGLNAPTQYGLPLEVEVVSFTAEDGVKSGGWYFPGQPDLPVLVYFHGNAGNLGDRIAKLRAYSAAGFGILAVSYRGYGNSESSPSEEGVYADARAALAYLHRAEKLPYERMALYGESLGSGVAIQMATEYPIAGLVLEAPYTSIVKRASEIYPWVPVPLLLKDRFDSISKIGKVKVPLLIFHNSGDRVVPQRHGRELFAAANRPKKAYWIEGPGHIDFDWKDVSQKMRDYFESRDDTI